MPLKYIILCKSSCQLRLMFLKVMNHFAEVKSCSSTCLTSGNYMYVFEKNTDVYNHFVQLSRPFEYCSICHKIVSAL